jgi:hypothetical protein
MSVNIHLCRALSLAQGTKLPFFVQFQIDEVIGQAQSTRVALSNQRAMFGDIQGKVKQLGEKFPIIRGLLGNILIPSLHAAAPFFFFWLCYDAIVLLTAV